jgi:hypothetical protein
MLECNCGRANYSDASAWLCFCGKFNGPIEVVSRGVFEENTNYIPIANDVAARPAILNVNLWRPLHEFAKTKATVEAQRAFVAQWETSLPDACGCQSKWLAFKYNFDYGDNFLLSTIFAHDLVSERLIAEGRQIYQVPIEQSLRLWQGPSVGVLALSYMNIGGTETWAQTLLPELRHRVNIVGFACLDKRLERGNPEKIKVPYYSDPEQLIPKCDILICWGTPSVVSYG